MQYVIEFFRDTLDGPFYIVWVVVLVILIFACIGYLAEKGIKNKKEKEKYATVSQNGSIDGAVVAETVSEPVTESSSQNVVVSNNITPPVVEADNTTTTPVNNVNETPPLVTEGTAVSVNNTVVMPNVVSENVEPVATVVSTNPAPEGVNNVVIPTINQDGNNKIV